MRRVEHFLPAIACFAIALFSGSAALADWRKTPEGFRVGMIEAAAPPPAGREAIRRALGEALGMPVQIVTMRNWPQLIDAHASGRLEYAIYSAAAYATAVELCGCVEPLAAPLDTDGVSGLRAAILVREPAAVNLEDMRRIAVAAGPEDDLAGWMAPKALLPDAGFDFDADAQWLRRAASASAALAAFRDAGADAIFGWERVMPTGESAPGGTAARIQDIVTAVLWRSPLLRYGPHAVSGTLDPEAKTLLTQFLTGLHAGDPQVYDLMSQGHGGGFSAVSATDYQVVRTIVSRIGAR